LDEVSVLACERSAQTRRRYLSVLTVTEPEWIAVAPIADMITTFNYIVGNPLH
jgi:hypothetical protein